MKNIPVELEYLRREIEEISGISLSETKGYLYLHEYVQEKLDSIPIKKNKVGQIIEGGDTIGYKTIRRLWEKEKDKHEQDDRTFSILARAAGYKHWEHFKKELKKKREQENLFDPDSIDTSKLKIGETVIIGWYPIYYISSEYLGDYTFKILNSSNPKRKTGDTFRAKWFEFQHITCIDDRGIGYEYNPQIYFHLEDKKEYYERMGIE